MAGDFWSCADLQGNTQTASMQFVAGNPDEFLAGEGDAGVRAGTAIVDREPDGATDRAAHAGDQELVAADDGVFQDGDLGRGRTVDWSERSGAGDGLVELDCGYDRRAAVSRFGYQERRCDAVIEREQEPAGEPVVDRGGLGAN